MPTNNTINNNKVNRISSILNRAFSTASDDNQPSPPKGNSLSRLKTLFTSTKEKAIYDIEVKPQEIDTNVRTAQLETDENQVQTFTIHSLKKGRPRGAS